MGKTLKVNRYSAGPENSFFILRIVNIVAMFVFQIGTPTLIIAKFGISGYGIWVFSLSIVCILNLCDFGLFNSVVNDVIALRTQGGNQRAESLLKALWSFILLVGFLLILLVQVFDFFVSLDANMDKLITTLAVAAILQIFIRLNEAISRAHLKVSGFAVLVVSYIFESFLLIIGIMYNLELGGLASLLIYSRILFVFFGFYINRHHVSIISLLEIKIHDMSYFLRNNIRKGIGFLALPIGYLLLFDISNIILGTLVSKEFVGELSLLRISTGIIRQFSSAVLASYSPVLSEAIFSMDWKILKKIQARMRLTLIVTISFICALLMISSNLIVDWYFQDAETLSVSIFVIYIFCTVIDIPWVYRATFLFSANLHEGIAIRFLLSSFLALVVVYFLGPLLGLIGVAIAFCVQDVVLTRYAFKKSSILLHSCAINSRGVRDE
jgi:hypothetical protein